MIDDLRSTFPTAADVTQAPLIVLAGALLGCLAREIDASRGRALTAGHILGRVQEGYRAMDGESAAQAALEAWDWLYCHGLICHSVHGDAASTWCTISRSGRQALASKEFGTWVAEREFPESLVHAALHGQCMNLFRQGEPDLAVMAAYKTVEVAIRTAAGFEGRPELVGTALAQEAFKKDGGPLADQAAEQGERVSLMHFMAGALGTLKNPQSHRFVGLEAAAAREMIVTASLLLRFIDEAVTRHKRWRQTGIEEGYLLPEE